MSDHEEPLDEPWVMCPSCGWVPVGDGHTPDYKNGMTRYREVHGENAECIMCGRSLASPDDSGYIPAGAPIHTDGGLMGQHPVLFSRPTHGREKP